MRPARRATRIGLKRVGGAPREAAQGAAKAPTLFAAADAGPGAVASPARSGATRHARSARKRRGCANRTDGGRAHPRPARQAQRRPPGRVEAPIRAQSHRRVPRVDRAPSEGFCRGCVRFRSSVVDGAESRLRVFGALADRFPGRDPMRLRHAVGASLVAIAFGAVPGVATAQSGPSLTGETLAQPGILLQTEPSGCTTNGNGRTTYSFSTSGFASGPCRVGGGGGPQGRYLRPPFRTARAVFPQAALTGHSPSGGSSSPCSESVAGG
jgi:hypothetical protein